MSGGVSTVKQYTYDLANNRLSFIATAGGTQLHNTGYTYDNQNRLKTVSDNGSLTATYSYNTNGARESLIYTNGTSEHYTYNLANWLTRLENRSGNTVVSSYDYMNISREKGHAHAHDGSTVTQKMSPASRA